LVLCFRVSLGKMIKKSVIRYPSGQETRALAQFRCVCGVYVVTVKVRGTS
jgi:hypothetical protein